MTAPFDDPDARHLVVVHGEAQHALWPALAGVPSGWTIALPSSSRQECLDHVERHWTDMRPASLIEAMAEQESIGLAGT
ncbi:MAG TPA: MbtH family NRPS accessory protein [Jatrophihabitans sp.]|jgi:MbtH protein